MDFKNIDDKKVKKLINGYKDGNIKIGQISDYLAGVIYAYPRLISGLDEDACSDFFEYILLRIEKIMEGYTEMDCLFLTWFSVVLRRHFYNWIKAKSSDIVELPILNSHISDDIKEEIVNTISYEEGQPDIRDEKIENAIEALPDKIKIIIKLHYFDFFKEEDLIFVHNEFGGDFVEVIARYHDLKEKVTNRTDRKLSLQEKVNKAYLRIMRLEESKNHQVEETVISDISTNLTKVREKHKRALKKLKKSFMTLKNQDIAYLVGISAKNVANLLFRGKKMLRDEISKIKIF